MLPHGSKKNVFPPLGNTPPIRGRVVVITRTDKNEEEKLLNLHDLSPFVLNKLITNHYGEVKRAKLMKNGSLLVECNSEQQAEKILKLKKLENQLNVTAVEHKTLNTSKCVFNCYELKNIATEVILKEFQKTDGKFMKIQRFSKMNNGEKVATNTFLITYKGPNPPTEVKVGFNLIKTRAFYPSPLRCFNCLAFGHFAKNCKRIKVCAKCSKPFHDGNCSNEIKCVVCKKAHHTLSEKCEQKVKQLLIVKTKVDYNLDYHQAKLEVENSTRAEYAEVVKKNKVSNMDLNYKQQIEELKNAVHSLQKNYEELKISIQSHKEDLNGKIKNLQTENAKLNKTIQKQQNADKQHNTPSDKESKKNNNNSSSQSNGSDTDDNEGFETVLSKKTRKYRKRKLLAEAESEYYEKKCKEATKKINEARTGAEADKIQMERVSHMKNWVKNLKAQIELYKISSDED